MEAWESRYMFGSRSRGANRLRSPQVSRWQLNAQCSGQWDSKIEALHHDSPTVQYEITVRLRSDSKSGDEAGLAGTQKQSRLPLTEPCRFCSAGDIRAEFLATIGSTVIVNSSLVKPKLLSALAGIADDHRHPDHPIDLSTISCI